LAKDIDNAYVTIHKQILGKIATTERPAVLGAMQTLLASMEEFDQAQT